MDYQHALTLSLPELTLSIGSLIALMFGVVRGDKGMTSVSALCGTFLILATYLAAMSGHGTVFNGAFVADPMALYTKCAIFISACFVIVLGQGYFDRSGNRRFEFPILIMLCALGMSMMVSSGDMIAMYIGIELQSLALYVLASFNRNDAKSSEAGLKYFVLGALSSGLLLYGISLVYGFSGSMNFAKIAAYSAQHTEIGLIFGLVFVIAGLAFKVSAAPFHMWTPDVYEGAPTPVVAFAAGAPKMAAMVLFARVLNEGFGASIDQWRNVILIIAVLSFCVGAFGGVMQKDFKRLMAYSSIGNMGYALLALACNNGESMTALLLFFTLYLVDTVGLFAAQMSLNRKGLSLTRIEDLKGLARTHMPLAIGLTVLALSVLGMPPFSGFWGKYFVFKAVIGTELWPYAALGLVASVIAAFYYLRMIKLIWFDAPTGEFDEAPRETNLIVMASAAFAFPLVIVALSWLYPLATQAGYAFGR